MARVFDRAFEMGLLNPPSWAFLGRIASKSNLPPNMSSGNFPQKLFLILLLSLFTRACACIDTDTDVRPTKLYESMTNQPAGRTADSTPTHFDFRPGDRRVQHLCSERVGVLFRTPHPLADHSRAQHRIVAP